MLFTVIAVWVVSTWLAFGNQRRGLALVSLILGGAITYGLLAGKAGYPGLIALTVLTIVLVIVNRFDMQ